MDVSRTGLAEHRKGWAGLLFYPLYAIAARVLICAKVRFLDVHIWALEDVGQLAMDFDTYLKEQILSHRKVVPVLLCLGRKPANEALLAHWSKHIRVIRGRWINELLRPLMTFPELVDSIPAYSIVHRGAAGNHGVISQWADRGAAPASVRGRERAGRSAVARARNSGGRLVRLRPFPRTSVPLIPLWLPESSKRSRAFELGTRRQNSTLGLAWAIALKRTRADRRATSHPAMGGSARRKHLRIGE